MAEINLTLNLPSITAEDLSALLSPLLSLGGVAASIGSTSTSTWHKDPEEQLTLKEAVEECPLSYGGLRARVVVNGEINFSRKSKAARSPVLIKRRDLWLLLENKPKDKEDDPTIGRPRSKTTVADIVLGTN